MSGLIGSPAPEPCYHVGEKPAGVSSSYTEKKELMIPCRTKGARGRVNKAGDKLEKQNSYRGRKFSSFFFLDGGEQRGGLAGTSVGDCLERARHSGAGAPFKMRRAPPAETLEELQGVCCRSLRFVRSIPLRHSTPTRFFFSPVLKLD